MKVPHTPDWPHEIKYDGYRLRLERDGDRVRLITRNGYDWTKRYPWIVESALKNRMKQFVIDGEAVILGVDGRSDFDALHSGKHNEEVQLYAFDMLAGDNQSRGTCAGWRYRNADANRGKRIDQSLRGQRDRIHPRDAEPRGGHHDASTTHAVPTSHLEPPDTPTPSAGGRGSADAVLRKSGPEWGTCSGPRASGLRQSPGAPACPIALIEWATRIPCDA